MAFVTEHAKVAAVRLRSPFLLPDDAPDEFVAECEARGLLAYLTRVVAGLPFPSCLAGPPVPFAARRVVMICRPPCWSSPYPPRSPSTTPPG